MQIGRPEQISVNEEDAFKFLVHSLMDGAPVNAHGYDVYMSSLIHAYIGDLTKGLEPPDAAPYVKPLSPQFMAASWELCRRGILRPGVRAFGEETTSIGSGGSGFSLTPVGREWLSKAQEYDYAFQAPGRFAALLAERTPRFGAAYAARAQDAIRCYGALAYLACCAMCGAAAESILLAVAIAKSASEEAVLKEYNTSGGRGRVEKRVSGQQPEQVQNEFRGFLSLLKYWRDSSAHGGLVALSETEAYTSLALLLRFAIYVDERWDGLTGGE